MQFHVESGQQMWIKLNVQFELVEFKSINIIIFRSESQSNKYLLYLFNRFNSVGNFIRLKILSLF